jgi:bacterioferritin-associated ferredoxin
MLEVYSDGRGLLPVGFKCGHCGLTNKFTGEDADLLDATGKKDFYGARVNCGECGKESIIY